MVVSILIPHLAAKGPVQTFEQNKRGVHTNVPHIYTNYSLNKKLWISYGTWKIIKSREKTNSFFSPYSFQDTVGFESFNFYINKNTDIHLNLEYKNYIFFASQQLIFQSAKLTFCHWSVLPGGTILA